MSCRVLLRWVHFAGSLGAVVTLCACHPRTVELTPESPANPSISESPRGASDGSATGVLAPGFDTGALAPRPTAERDSPVAATRYVCPHHPEVHSDQPGVCPRCKMDLVPQSSYVCPHHPEVHSDQPGVCPRCKMDLVPEQADDAAH